MKSTFLYTYYFLSSEEGLVRLRRVLQHLQEQGKPEDPHAPPRAEEHVPVRVLRQVLQVGQQPQLSHPGRPQSHRARLPLRPLRQGLQGQEQPEEASLHPLQREAVRVQGVREGIHPARSVRQAQMRHQQLMT